MIISLKLTPQDEQYLRDLASRRDINVSEYIRQAVIERIEYESDFQSYRKNLSERSSKPVIYSLDKYGCLTTI